MISDDDIRRIVQEEIQSALRGLAVAADSLNIPYETGDIRAEAMSAIQAAAERAVDNMTN